jgi:hypothetical protein
MLATDLENVLNKYGDEILEAIQKRLKDDDKYATGKAYNQLIKKVTPNSLSIEGWKYIEVISGGREPNKTAPPIHKIIEWLEAKKGMTIKSTAYKNKRGRIGSLAYIIAKRIGERGIKGNNMLTDIRLYFMPKLDTAIADVVQNEIIRIEESIKPN